MMHSPACVQAFPARNCRRCGRKRAAGYWRSAPPFPSPICSVLMRYDALIIGAGPAGSAAARLLPRAGWRVGLTEKPEFPRRKVCGEFISAPTLAVLKDCGVAAPFIAAAG